MDETLKKELEGSFLERMTNAANEKFSHYTKQGWAEDDVAHAIIQVIKNLPHLLLPLKMMPAKEEVYSDELAPSGNTDIKRKTPTEPEPEDYSVIDRYHFH
ncbi:MAG: hypothetical protein HW401_177 [Parcubacteria group bacterium]|nr:hypothetical protein [Parcubacteria group bacterium]